MASRLISILICMCLLMACAIAQKKTTTAAATTTPPPTTTTPAPTTTAPPPTGTCPPQTVEDCQTLASQIATQCNGPSSYETCQVRGSLDVQLCKDTPGCDVNSVCNCAQCRILADFFGMPFKPVADYEALCTGVCALSPAPQCYTA